jgi:hypothetical protein
LSSIWSNISHSYSTTKTTVPRSAKKAIQIVNENRSQSKNDSHPSLIVLVKAGIDSISLLRMAHSSILQHHKPPLHDQNQGNSNDVVVR